jgi:hypothetical protein
MAVPALRLFDLLFGDLRCFAIGGTTGRLGSCGFAMRRGIAGWERHLNGLIVFLFFVLLAVGAHLMLLRLLNGYAQAHVPPEIKQMLESALHH